MSRKKKKNVIINDLKIESIGQEGVAVARKDELVHFVTGAVPGDTVDARLTGRKRNLRYADTETITDPSPDRIDPVCRHFGPCGGCKWQNLSYEKQLYWKSQIVKDAFERIGKVPVGQYEQIMPAEEQYYYRNKMDFSFGASRWMTNEEIKNQEEIEQKHFALGLHIPGRFDKVLDIERCHIQNDEGNEILNIMREKALELETRPYHDRFHDGFLRNLVIRSSRSTGEIMVVVITTTPETEDDLRFMDWLKNEAPDELPMASDIIHSVNDAISPNVYGKSEIIKGTGYITENILGIEFRISPFSFFQTNSAQLNKFIAEIIDFAELKDDEILWDLYCGTGSIALPASSKVKEVYGMEMMKTAVADARENMELNEIKNAEFFAADLHDKDIPSLFSRIPKPDVMTIDPPRAGMHKRLAGHILEIASPRLVYVSCNPVTQARDCSLLAEKYDVVKVKPVDMFPHTSHVESIALLELRQ